MYVHMCDDNNLRSTLTAHFKYIVNCSHHSIHEIPGPYSPCMTETLYLLTNIVPMSPTHPLATTILISAPVSLISLDFTYK